MSTYEVPEPILNSPYDEPQAYWYIEEGNPPEHRSGADPPGISTAIPMPQPAIPSTRHAVSG